MKAAVIYDSRFGNNMRLAQAFSQGLEHLGVAVDCIRVGTFDVNILTGYDLLAVGGPTNMAQMSKPMKEFFQDLKSVDLKGKKGFCWGTRVESKMNFLDINGSAKKIEAKLKRKGVHLIKPTVNVIVLGREGPTVDGSEELFKPLGAEFASNQGIEYAAR